ncbi:SPW repeat domain-containing protein [Sorangium sp. So ce1153]|uniref:SPW repeat domain-containing protein n=1 Tax=Sorangium sp. So ce1153 TaxID=3133333 RepID=UPI003F602B86
MKLLSPRHHGYVDYAAIILLLIAPLALRFGPAPAAVCYATALAHLVVTLLSDHPLGAARKIPFAVHGALEFSLGVGLLASPWLLGFSAEDRPRTFFVAAGIALLLVVLVTRYTAGLISRPESYGRYDRYDR